MAWQSRRAWRRADRGREASDPLQITRAGWKDVFWRTYRGINEKNLFLVAGGVTYYILLALFPALVALVSLYGLAFDRAQVEKQINAMSGVMPDAARQIVATEMHQIVSASGGALGIGAVIGILFALYSASRGTSGMISGLDIAYGETETRSIVRFNLLALGMTLVLLVGGLVAIALVAVLPAAVTNVGNSSGVLKWAILIAEWPLLLLIVTTILAVLYRFLPDRHPPQWRWLTPGAVTGAVLWVIGSILFSIYVSNFGNYNATYGSLGAVVVLMTWLYLSAFVALLGAQINAEMERQTKQDTTKAGDKPMGERRATAADTLGPET